MNPKTFNINLSQEERDKLFAEAQRLHEEALKNESRAKSVDYDPKGQRLALELFDGRTIGIPVRFIQGLSTALPEDIAKVQLTEDGDFLQWDALELDLTVDGLVNGVFGTRAWMAELGRKGGSATTEAKAAAARANGRRGGRPRKSLPSQLLAASKRFKVLPLHREAEPLNAGLSETSHMPTSDLIRYESGLCAAYVSVRNRLKPTQSKLVRNTLSSVEVATLKPSEKFDSLWMEVKDNAEFALAA